MSRLPITAAAVAAIVGGGFFLGRFELGGLKHLELRSRGSGSAALPAALPGGEAAIRVASFNLEAFGDAKLAQPTVVHTLCETLRRFDVIALQDVRSRSQDILPKLVAALNAQGGRYDFVIGPRVGRGSDVEQLAFVFNTASVEVAPDTFYTVNDPDDLLLRDPLVAGFRVRAGSREESFTFSLVNVHLDAERVVQELAVLDDVVAAVRQDGRQEDDVIVLGEFGVDESRLGELLGSQRFYAAIFAGSGRPTPPTANILFSRRATAEFTGSAGAFDVMRELNITGDQAQAVSSYTPVWAEFDVREGGKPGRVALR